MSDQVQNEKAASPATSPLVQAIANRLLMSGYQEVETPFKVASVSFDFTRALRGRDGRSLDLVVIVDTTTGGFEDTDFVQVKRRIEALSRALDIAGSRLVLTAILAGAATRNDIESLSETCRVLIVESISVASDGAPKSEKARQQLEDRIRLLLPLEIPPRDDGERGDMTSEEALRTKLPKTIDQDFLTALLSSSHQGEEAVERELGRLIGASLKVGDSP